jgi:polar amino acid transport system substrate-binding protein
MSTLKRLLLIGSLPRLIIGLFLLAFAAYYFFFPKPLPKPDATWTRIQQEGVLKIGIDPSFPPFESDDGQGHLSGFDIALAEALASKWSVKIQYVYSGFDGLYDALNGDQFDMILSALPYNPQKTEDVNFSHSYFNGGPVLVVLPTDNQTTTIYNLAGRAVAVELGTSGDAFARKWQRRVRLDLREFNTTPEALRAVQSGQVAAALIDPISFYDFQRAESDTGGLKKVGDTLSNEYYNIAVRKDSPTLLQQINAAIDAMKRDGSLEELQKKSF